MSPSFGVSVRETLKKSNAIVGFVHDARRLLGAVIHPSKNNRIVSNYLQTHEVRKLQIGAGPSQLKGWLSADINPTSNQILYLDATKPFEFADQTFDYVYSEHMIEHITWEEGLLMLGECWRVLKPGGTIRIATPDLKVLLNLYTNPQEPKNAAYIKWITDTFLDEVTIYQSSFVINNAFHNWGHQFLYDAEVLAFTLRAAGFEEVRQRPCGQSDDPHLHGIELHGENVGAKDMAAFETMVFEARRSR